MGMNRPRVFPMSLPQHTHSLNQRAEEQGRGWTEEASPNYSAWSNAPSQSFLLTIINIPEPKGIIINALMQTSCVQFQEDCGEIKLQSKARRELKMGFLGTRPKSSLLFLADSASHLIQNSWGRGGGREDDCGLPESRLSLRNKLPPCQ